MRSADGGCRAERLLGIRVGVLESSIYWILVRQRRKAGSGMSGRGQKRRAGRGWVRTLLDGGRKRSGME